MKRTTRVINTFHGSLELGRRTLVMGILNITPDSFSDGGEFTDPAAAAEHAFRMVQEGADLIDVGGESTRPGSDPVDAVEQIRRVVPVIQEIRSRSITVPISIDTQSALVASAAIDGGADLVNDVSGVRGDPSMSAFLADRKVPFILMHMQGTPKTMQDAPQYDNVVGEICAFFAERAAALERAGVDTSRMLVDPGIGFGKAREHNLEILSKLRQLRRTWPVVVGPSRKRFLQDTGACPDAATTVVVLHCALCEIEMVRVHAVGPAVEAVRAAGTPGI